jgi:hypothetical protein
MARPKLTTDIKLSKRLIFRLSEAELSTLSAIAKDSGLPLGVMIRRKLFSGKFPNPIMPRIELAVYMELKKSGVNLNQLTKKVNSGKLPLALYVELVKLQKQQQTIIELLLYDRHSENR